MTMSGDANQQPASDTPYESIPTLAANERFVQLCEELRRLKLEKDAYFEERKVDDGKKRPSYWDELKLEAGAIAAAAGLRSVTFIDLRIAQTDPGKPPEKVTGESLLGNLENATVEQLKAALLAAKELDPDKLLAGGIPANVIGKSRVVVGKGASGSTRVEWVGKKGPASA